VGDRSESGERGVTAEMVRAWCDRGVVRWGGRGERGAKADGACVRGAKREKVACVERAWCERDEQIRVVLCIVPYARTLFLCFDFLPTSFSLYVDFLYLCMYGTTYVFAHNWRPANTESPTDRETDRRIHELKTCGS
jgi:hypothetical protein